MEGFWTPHGSRTTGVHRPRLAPTAPRSRRPSPAASPSSYLGVLAHPAAFRTVSQMSQVQFLIQSAAEATDPLALLRAARQQQSDVARVLLHCQIRWVGTHASAEVCHQDEPEKDPR